MSHCLNEECFLCCSIVLFAQELLFVNFLPGRNTSAVLCKRAFPKQTLLASDLILYFSSVSLTKQKWNGSFQERGQFQMPDNQVAADSWEQQNMLSNSDIWKSQGLPVTCLHVREWSGPGSNLWPYMCSNLIRQISLSLFPYRL